MVDTSLQDAGMSRVSPEMAFSHRVDIFEKKTYRKILSFKKVTAGGLRGGRDTQK